MRKNPARRLNLINFMLENFVIIKTMRPVHSAVHRPQKNLYITLRTYYNTREGYVAIENSEVL